MVVVYAWFVSLSAAFRFVVVSFCVSERELTLTTDFLLFFRLLSNFSDSVGREESKGATLVV